MKPFKYEMEKRREKWKSINEQVENIMMIPLEARQSVVEELVSPGCYKDLACMLDLPSITLPIGSKKESMDTLIDYNPAKEKTLVPRRKSTSEEPKLPPQSTRSGSTLSSRYRTPSSESISAETIKELLVAKSEMQTSSEDYEALSEFVEVEQKIPHDHELTLKQKAILKFLGLPETEAATWRVKEAKDVSDLSEMTLEEQGDFLINKVAVDFCEWIKKLGGDEKSFISEEILKDLFQVGMDNPASRAICIKMREKRVLYYALAEFLQVPEKSFHEVLSSHLNWDTEIEKKPSKLIAFGKALPKDFRFKAPKNKTAERWVEWNKVSKDQLSFADVYSKIKDLRSTTEYCKWLIAHPEYKRPQYLVDQGMFEPRTADPRRTILKSDASEHRVTLSTIGTEDILFADIQHLFEVKVD